MTTAERAGLYSRVEVERHRSGPVPSIAPNGSSRSVDYWTLIVYRGTWSNDAANGVYAGRSYREEERYVSSSPTLLGQFTSSSSQPW